MLLQTLLQIMPKDRVITSETMLSRIALPSEGRLMFRDKRVPALYLQVTAKGAMTWYLMSRLDGKQIKRKLGLYTKNSDAGLGLTEARRVAEEYKTSFQCGIDPDAKELNPRLRNTFDTVFQVFLQQHVYRNLKPSTQKSYESLIGRDYLDAWRDKPVHQITRHDVLEVLGELVNRGTLVHSNRVLAYLRKFFNWCAEMDYIRHDEAIPTDRVKPPLKKEPKRSRFLSIDEAACVFQAATEQGYPFGQYYLLLLLTGQRSSEVVNLRWKDINFDEQLWYQAENKADRPHVVPLSDLAISVIESIPRLKTNANFVFSTNGSTPVSGFSKSKKRLDENAIEVAKEAGLEQCFTESWRTHDLRRTVTTHLRKNGISREVCSRILNHSESGVTALHYDIHDMLDEKRKALALWSSLLNERGQLPLFVKRL